MTPQIHDVKGEGSLALYGKRNLFTESISRPENIHTHKGPPNSSLEAEEQYAHKKERVQQFMAHLMMIRVELTAELAAYQSYAATQDEFERIFECLGALD